MAESTNNIIYNVQVDTKTGQINIDGLTKGFMQADKAVLKLQNDIAKGTSGAAKSVKGLGDASGSATSSVMELSRVVSDAPYGIRGMANNITQLVSQMGTASVKAGGLGGALKEMGKQLNGPLGIVLAITMAVSALDYFFGANKKAKDSTEDFSASISDNASKLLILNQVLQSSNTSMIDKKEIINDVNSEFKDLNLSLDENGSLTDASRIALDKLTNSMVKNAKAQAIMKKITEEQSTIVDIEIEQAAKIREAAAENTLGVGLFEGTLKGLVKKQNEYIERYQRQIDYNNLTEQKKKDAMESYMNTTTMQRFEYLKNFRKDDLKDAEKNIADMVALLTGTNLETFVYTPKNDKAKKATTLQTPKEFRADAESLQSEINDWDKKMLMSATKDKDQKLQLELIFYKKEKELRRKEQIDEARDNLSKYEDSLDKLVKAGKMESSEAEKAKGDAITKTREKVDGINKEHDRLIEKAEEVTKALRLGVDDKDKTEEDIALFNFKIEQYMKVFSGLTDFMNGEFDRQATMEENKTNKMNNELNKRLLNENLSKDERRRIQLQIGANDDRLRIKQEAIEKKRFKLNKAANLAQAGISTYLNAIKAEASQYSVPTADAPLRAKIAKKAAIVSGVISMAAIARQKFQSSAGSGGQIGGGFGGGSGSGGNDRDFNFNLAGTSQQNQLAQTLQGQFSQPLQAYVVGRDITNQQQLDEEILSNSSF